MAGAKGSALDWALALLQAPGERHALRARPLPPGIEQLLAVAAGAPEALAQAVSRLAEPEDRLREAARFYAREILFFPQADAYRTLGVGPEAPFEQIKCHHRLLQLWLHPDRQQGEDDAVFATRVNSAWNRLRSPERREAYDEAIRQQRPPELFDSNGKLHAMPAWEPVPLAEPIPLGRWRHRLPGMALALVCLMLAVLVLQDMGRRPEAWDQEKAQAPLAKLADGLGIRVPARPAHEERQLTPEPPAHRAATGATTARTPDPGNRRSATGSVQAPLPTAALSPAPFPEPLAQTPMPAAAPEPLPVAQSTAAVAVAAATPVPEPSRKPAPAVPEPPDFARIQAARQVGEQFLQYMASPKRPPPPIWNSPAIQSSADQVRQDLHQAGRPDIDRPRWRIGNEMAVLTTDYAAGGALEGSLTADLVWREGQWLVTGLSVEKSQ